MDIQELRIDRFLIDIKNTYSRISFFFGDSDFSGEGSKQYREIKEAFSKAKERLSNDIHLDRFNSETARQRVVSELNKAIELIKDAEPDVFPFEDKSAVLSAAIVEMINKINTMNVDDI